jgi:UDP-N-acetyl-D-galactosamine dehydrogenase
LQDNEKVVVVGLGYVGLPLAVAVARSYPTVGFDVNRRRIGELRDGYDRTAEVDPDVLKGSSLSVTDDVNAIRGAAYYIVTVPTPVDAAHKPDLGAVRAACRTVGQVMAPGAVVVFESTVYPGVTEDICGPELEKASGMKAGEDFFLGYSPERINPGDREHTVDKIAKVVAGQTPEVTQRLAALYGAVTSGGIHVAADIRTAEAAKVIENAQRDINIAFVNEVAAICQYLGISAYDVLEAAGTKWNFLPFRPGLVGGHCIGVDPYYLAHRAQELGHDPEIILAGRRLNDGMGDFIAGRIDGLLAGPSKVLLLGLTFKEDVPDLRNSRVIDVIEGLKKRGHQVVVHDPIADREEALAEYDLRLADTIEGESPYDAVIGAVSHREYRNMTPEGLCGLLKDGGLVADIKGMWRGLDLPAQVRRWSL